jgi:hypothetical protein
VLEARSRVPVGQLTKHWNREAAALGCCTCAKGLSIGGWHIRLYKTRMIQGRRLVFG